MADLYRINLLEGNVTGRIKIVHRLTGLVAIRLSRNALCRTSDLPEINHAGIYFLFGKELSSSGNDIDVVYIGQADRRNNGQGILGRLKEHANDPRKSYFDYAIGLTDLADNWDAGELCHLERSFYLIARNANRFVVKNANTPRGGGLSEDDQHVLDRIIGFACQMLALLGRDFTVREDERIRIPGPENDSLAPDYVLEGTGFRAIGRPTMNGFTVLQGSTIRSAVSARNEPWIEHRRRQFSNAIDSSFRLQHSIPFSSPSAAASFVLGRQANGWKEWKCKGRSLREIERIQSQEAGSESAWTSSSALAKAVADKYYGGRGADRIAKQLIAYRGCKAGPDRQNLFRTIGIQLDEEGRVVQPNG